MILASAVVSSLVVLAMLAPLLTSGESDFDRTTLNFFWVLECVLAVSATLAWASL